MQFSFANVLNYVREDREYCLTFVAIRFQLNIFLIKQICM